MIRVLGFEPWQGLGIFLFTTASRTALGPTQTPIQWIAGALYMGVKWSGYEADRSPPSSAKVKECVELYLLSPVCLHDVVLSKKKKSIETTTFTLYLTNFATESSNMT
jgi:hypothetical protein